MQSKKIYPELITEKNFHITYEIWEELLHSKNINYYDDALIAIAQHGYPKLSSNFASFIAFSFEETLLNLLVRVCSCLYAHEQGEITYQEATELIKILVKHTTIGLSEVQFFQYSTNMPLSIDLDYKYIEL